MCTRQEFSEYVATMKCIYTLPTFLPDLESIEMWYIVLRHYTYADLKKAFASYYPVKALPPTPADLIGLLARPTNKTAVTAWNEVLQYIGKHGAGDGVRASDFLDDLTIKAVRSVGGLEAIRNCPMNNISFLMRQFVSAYDDSIQQETLRLLPNDVRRMMIGYDGNCMLGESQL